ncbi:hypothetical protein BDV95DRAFT_499227 [Massariosphaeria phaeospora]|uniref:tyrosinase n=1 Tax=Massariosphaeria phaeospora TaxID=100035 RepID=A0A7C8I2F1_9PLEO|nr:hypothetical protein BDV95DRAFT_499227 [Massariosphaeria phaeospora]
MAAFSKPRGAMAMLFALLVLIQVTVAFQHGAQHSHRSPKAMEEHYEETVQHLQERQSGFLEITGIRSGGVQPRLEIRELKKNADQWNLYLLGMEKFQGKPHSDRLSYYQVAGVHGRPYVTWNNFSPMVNRAGFCTHASTLFASWHRPYLAVYEQALYVAVTEVVNSFPKNQRQRWRNAAANLRMPYWDWAAAPPNGESNMPTLMRDQRVTVTKPSGQVSIANPLYSYTFGSSLPAEMQGGPWNSHPTTLRRPIGNPTRSNNNEVNARMSSIRISLRDRLFGIFASKQSFGFVSSSQIGVRTQQNGGNFDSFESVHDAIHVTVGGETLGHMYYLDHSAFDPAFWLHHTNIDRLLAMHQKLTPNTYIANGNINRPMAQWKQGEAKNANSPLKPFTKNSRGDFFTSNDVRETAALGYSYPETRDNPDVRTMESRVARLYGPSSGGRKRAVSDGQYEGREFKKGDHYTVMSIQANKYAIDGSYAVHCFVGKPGAGNSTSNSTAPFPAPGNSTTPTGDYTEDPNYVGMYAILGGSMAGGSNSSQPIITEGSIPLTTCLQGKEATGELKSLHPDDVSPYLKENLHYKIIGPGGVELDTSTLPDLHIYVKSCPITPSAGGLPELGDFTVLPEVTEDKPAGAPYEYVPTPLGYVTPGPGKDEPEPAPYPFFGPVPGVPSSPSGVSPPYPSGTMSFGGLPLPEAPEQEEGYCVSKQTIKYVDQDGNFLYEETTG